MDKKIGKITPQVQNRILDVAAIIASQQMGGNVLKANSDEVRVLLQATRLVTRLPDVLEACALKPELLHGNCKDVIELAIDHVKAVSADRLAALKQERTDANIAESQKIRETDDAAAGDDKAGDDEGTDGK